MDPTSGAPGSVVSVSGDGCTTEDPALLPIGFTFMFRVDDELTEDDLLAINQVDASPDGTWATSLTVPEGFDPEGIYFVGAVCVGLAETPRATS